ncbi:MAG: arginine deiminase family protein [Salinivirgaceae bacterium]|jgi:arginine deiminase|nr:arginine deiminase family protein [Salinivirgaceae bacterium]
MTQKNIQVQVSSEVGELEAVIVHTPGQEVENMTPKNAERALYSDILNLSVAQKEYSQFKGVLEKHAQVFEMRDLLKDILEADKVKKKLLDEIFQFEKIHDNIEYLLSLSTDELTHNLIEGVIMKKDNLTRFFHKDRYSLRPLHNFFFMRDASMSINNEVLIGKMASLVRDRETRIMEAIFNHHPTFSTKTVNAARYTKSNAEISIEGGDVLVAREDILIIGTGTRTTSHGIDFILEQAKVKGSIKHIIVQELPSTLESFIHLDMVFTFLDNNKCMVYEPVILSPNKYRTVHIQIDNGKVKIDTVSNLISILNKLGFEIEPVFCGGQADPWTQEREQWHSGANFFALAPGKVIGYARNVYTQEEMNKHGFEIIKAKDVLNNKIDLLQYQKYMISIDGSELARGGGGARCMSMPVRRKIATW